MKKRTRITALITTLCLCLSLFVVGVLAATSATFNVTSTLNFQADGVYVMVDASLKQGSNVTDATLSTGENIIENSYKAYSYPRVSGQDYPSGAASTEYFVNENNEQDNDWTIGQIDYSSENTVVVYEFVISNYSAFVVSATITTNLADIISSSNGQLSVNTYKDNALDSSATYTFNIPARTSETEPGELNYKIVVTLNSFLTSFNTDTINLTFNFNKSYNANYSNFVIVGNEIVSLVDSYVEDEPGLLIIPGYSEDGNTLLSCGYLGYLLRESTTKLIFLEGLTGIVDNAFASCLYLESVKFPSTLTSIGEYAFSGCAELKNITFSDNSQLTNLSATSLNGCTALNYIDFGENSKLTEIESNTFYNSSLISIKIPKMVESIESYAFKNCTFLENVYFEENSNLQNLGSNVFENCSSLKNLTIPNGIQVLSANVFLNCTSLESAIIPDSVITINPNIFAECTNLKNVEIGNSVTSMFSNIFGNCISLSSITIKTIVPPTIYGELFTESINNLNIYVPAEAVDAYKTASGWSDFADIISAIP